MAAEIMGVLQEAAEGKNAEVRLSSAANSLQRKFATGNLQDADGSP
jgi:hypothetical protein